MAMTFIRALLLFAITVALSACGSTNVVFDDIDRAPHPDDRVVSVVYDRYGSLYPSNQVHVDPDAMHAVFGDDHLRLAG